VVTPGTKPRIPIRRNAAPTRAAKIWTVLRDRDDVADGLGWGEGPAGGDDVADGVGWGEGPAGGDDFARRCSRLVCGFFWTPGPRNS
jgi:hypothetical protein